MSIHVYRSYQQVNAYRWEIYDLMSDPNEWPKYHPHTEKVTHVPVVPLVVGDLFHETTKTLGMVYEWVWEVCSADRSKGRFMFGGGAPDDGLEATISYKIDEVIADTGNVLPVCHVHREFKLGTRKWWQDFLLKAIRWHMQGASDQYLRNIADVFNES